MQMNAKQRSWLLDFPARKRAVWGATIAQTDRKRSKIRYKIKVNTLEKVWCHNKISALHGDLPSKMSTLTLMTNLVWH